jgi:hypothetical protein
MLSKSRFACASRWVQLLGSLLGMLLLALLLVPPGVLAQQPHRAGLVIRHGDGRVVYRVVEFTEPEITGADLLLRSQVVLLTAGYGGMGQAVCSLDGEGCPADNCFCKSYTNPAYFWRYYHLNADGTWSSMAFGPDSRKIHDGDIDGWSWTTGDSGLPNITIDEVATKAANSAAPAAGLSEPGTPGLAASTPPAAAAPSSARAGSTYLGFVLILLLLAGVIGAVLIRGRSGRRS